MALGLDVNQLDVLQLIVQTGFAGLAVWLIIDTRRESAKREIDSHAEAARREADARNREEALMKALGEERIARTMFQTQVTAQFASFTETLKRIEERLEKA